MPKKPEYKPEKEKIVEMKKVSEGEIEFIAQCLKEGKPLPDSYRYIIPFETKKEYELTYAKKEREEDILADTMRVPLQPVKTFGSNGSKGWTNKLIFGDNLQVLKELTYDPEVKRKVRLIYIDPPFATKQEFRGNQDQKAYQDKIIGAQFLEFLRKRLVFLKELLADDGSIYVHLDWKKGHYVKALMDEVLGEHRFRSEIIWKYFGPTSTERNFPRKHDLIFFYTKTDRYYFDESATLIKYDEKAIRRYDKIDKDGKQYKLYYDKNGNVRKAYMKEGKPSEILQIPFIQGIAKERTGFPTQKPETLIERIIRASSKKGGIVLDAFAGSGTTGAVAEKLDRRWIMIDCGKLAIYTMQKRLLNLKKEIGNRGKPLKPKPFTLYNAGLYDYKMVKDLLWDDYREFVLKLFQCRDEKHRIAGIELDGYLGANHVMVFNYKKHKDVILDRGFIDDLYKILGDKIGYRFFIITPAASVMFFEDYIERGKTKYFVLRIPYSIIDELHRKGFAHIKQPVSEMDVNNTVDAVGFDFIQMPEVECQYSYDTKSKECVIKIKKFKSNIISKKPMQFENLETLSMIMTDYDYNGKVFDFDDVFYAEDLKQKNHEIRFDSGKIDGQIMIIYVDIFGNEKREVKKLKDFKERK